MLAWVVTWKAQKLLYSKFFGVKTNDFYFRNPVPAQTLFYRAHLLNTALTWSLLILVNLWTLLNQVTWGSQMYIMLVENIILSFVYIGLGFYEHKRMLRFFETQGKL